MGAFKLHNATVLNAVLPCVVYEGKDYLVGVQVAHLIEKETFNMYRSLKRNGVTVLKGSPEIVQFLREAGIIGHSHSVTLIPLEGTRKYLKKLFHNEIPHGRKRPAVTSSRQRSVKQKTEPPKLHQESSWDLLVAISVRELANIPSSSSLFENSEPKMINKTDDSSSMFSSMKDCFSTKAVSSLPPLTQLLSF